MSKSPAQACSKSFDDLRHETAPSLGAEQTLSCNDNTDRYGISTSPAQTDTNLKPFFGPVSPLFSISPLQHSRPDA